MKINLKIVCIIFSFFFVRQVPKINGRYPQNADLGDFPSIVAFVFTGVGELCSGVLISTWHVTLPAHCVLIGEPMIKEYGKIVAGDVYWNGTASLSRQERKIKALVINSKYNCETFENDIAVIQVDAPFNLTEYVRFRAIADTSPTVGSRCFIPYWPTKGRVRPLQYMMITIARSESCARLHDTFMKNKMICAGQPGEEYVCKNNVAGPLICKSALQGLSTGDVKLCDKLGVGVKYTAAYALRGFLLKAFYNLSDENMTHPYIGRDNCCMTGIPIWLIASVPIIVMNI